MLDNDPIEIYSSRDRIRNQLIELSKRYLSLENFDFNQTSYLSYIIDMLSVLSSNIIYYNTSVYREHFLTKALQKESVLNHAITLGYRPPLSNPASVDLLMSIPLDIFSSSTKAFISIIGRNHFPTSVDELNRDVFKAYSDSASIPFSLKNTILIEVNNPDGYIIVSKYSYEKIDGKIVNNGITPVDYKIVNNELQFYANFIQLTDITETFTIPILRPYEFYNFKFTNRPNIGYLSDINLFFIETEGPTAIESWNSRDSLFLLSSEEKGFEYRELDDGVKISFGNNIIGKQPKSGSQCIVTVGITNGLSGNVIAGSIRKCDDVPFVFQSGDLDSTNNNPVISRILRPKVVNTQPSFGGTNPPTIDEIRSEAIKNVSMNNRLVSFNDFKNTSTIIPDLPINNIFQVLKRSDIKNSEIALFTDIIYDNYLVPTRNTHLEQIIIPETETTQVIKKGTIVEVDSTSYITMFDLIIDSDTKECLYRYIINEMNVPVTLIETPTSRTSSYDELTKILPKSVKINSIRDEDPERISLELSALMLNISSILSEEDSTNSTFECKAKLSWTPRTNGINEYTLYFNNNESTTSSYIYTTESDSSAGPIILKIDDIPEGEVNIVFSLNEIKNDTTSLINKSKISLIIKKDLTDFMYSQVVEQPIYGVWITYEDFMNKDPEWGTDITLGNTLIYGYDAEELEEEYVDWFINKNYIKNAEVLEFDDYTIEELPVRPLNVYDVPIILRQYYNTLSNKGDFEFFLYQKIAQFNVNNYKMITDNVSIKFANTTGQSQNMKYNKNIKDGIIWNINPSSVPLAFSLDMSGEAKYAFYGSDNPWNTETYGYKKEGYIATFMGYDSTSVIWSYDKLNVNDLFLCDFRDNSELYDEDSEPLLYIYTGKGFVKPTITIPIDIRISVTVNSSTADSNTSIINKIKTKLIDEFGPKFGYNKNIYVSEIIKIVQSIQGIQTCSVLSPEHDIFFDEDPYETMTQEEILRYTPELIYFDTNNIFVEIKTER